MFAIAGDGGFILNLGELATLVQERANLVILLMNDQRYGVIRNIQDAVYGSRHCYVDLHTPDYSKLAESLNLRHGLVTDLLDVSKYDIVLTCGPMVMMRGVAKLCAAAGVPCLASLEKKMACGLGACLGCTCHTKIGPVTVCKDGPVFRFDQLDELPDEY